MFDQVAGKDIQEAFGKETEDGANEIGAGRNAAERKAEIDDVGGNDVDAAAENHGPYSIFLNAFVDAPDQFLFAVSLHKIGGEGKTNHVIGGHYSYNVHDPADQQSRGEIEQESQCHGEVKER